MRAARLRKHFYRTLLERLKQNRGAIPWGTDLSTIAPTILNANADVPCPAAAVTTAIQSQSGGTPVPLSQVNAFDVYPLIMGVLTIVLGGTAPSALVISYATTAGTAIDSYTVEPGLLVNSAELVIPIFFAGPVSSKLFTGAGKNPLIQVAPTGQDVTVTTIGSRAIFQLVVGNE